MDKTEAKMRELMATNEFKETGQTLAEILKCRSCPETMPYFTFKGELFEYLGEHDIECTIVCANCRQPMADASRGWNFSYMKGIMGGEVFIILGPKNEDGGRPTILLPRTFFKRAGIASSMKEATKIAEDGRKSLERGWRSKKDKAPGRPH